MLPHSKFTQQLIDWGYDQHDVDSLVALTNAGVAPEGSLYMATRWQIENLVKAFGRPVRTEVTQLTVTERELMGKLLLEECVETICKGLGLAVVISPDYVGESDMWAHTEGEGARPYRAAFTVALREGAKYDPIEYADGLGDINVIIHGNAWWAGVDLDKVTTAIVESQFTKFVDGKPVVNGVTVGYRADSGFENGPELGFDSTKPIGKWIKGPDYKPADMKSVLRFDENMCPGHTASDHDNKVCKYCGTHVSALAPDESDYL